MERVGPYEVHEQLGRGGMGVVARAVDTRTGGEVALKLLVSADERSRRRLLQEARALMRLRHANIVALMDAGEHQGRPWIALELVRGASLQERLDRHGPLPVDEAVRLVLSAASGISHAHRRGVLHRDLKPSNVLVPERGEPRVVDFGLAGFAFDLSQSRLTQSGALMGTPGYWAPEQALGRRELLGPATDVYGLGALLYAALTGRPPIAGESFADVIGATATVRPEPLEVDPALDAIAQRCLEKRPEDRYPDVDALTAALWTYLLGEPPGAPRSRRGLVVAAGALLAAVGLVVGAGALVARARAARERDEQAARAAAAARIEEQAAILRRSLLFDGRSLDALRAALPGHEAPSAPVLAAAVDALLLAAAPRDVPVDDVLARLDAAIAGAGDDLDLAARLHLGAADLALRRLRIDEVLRRTERAAPTAPLLRARLGLRRAAACLHVAKDDEARRVWEAVVRDDPEGAAGLVARSALATLDGRRDEALRLARRAVELDGANPMARLRLVSVLGAQERSDEVRAELDRYLELTPDDASALWLRCGVLEKLGRSGDAMRDLDRVVALTEPAPPPHVLTVRAELLLRRGELRAALADAERAVAAGPAVTPLILRGALHDQLGDAALADLDWQRAYALDPSRVEEILRRAAPDFRRRVWRGLGLPDFEDAPPGLRTGELTPELEAHLQARADAAPPDARAVVLRALRLAARGAPWIDVDAALREAEAQAPADLAVQLEVARLAVGRDAHARATAALARARELGADPRQLDLLEADLTLRHGLTTEALRRFQALAAADPDGPEGLLARATVDLLTGRRATGLATTRRVLERAPDHPGARIVEGDLLLSGSPPDVRGALEAVVQGMSTIGASDTRLLMLRFRCMGQVVLRELRDATPNDPGATTRLMTALRELTAIAAMTDGAGPLIVLGSLLLDVRSVATATQAEQLFREAERRQPERPDLQLLRGRLLLRSKAPPGAVLEAWRRAREQEPLVRIPSHYVAEFVATHGEHPALRELTRD